MRSIPLLILGILISCNDGGSSFKRKTNTTEQQQTGYAAPSVSPEHDHHHQPPVVIEEAPEDNSKSHQLVIEIDQVNSVLTITGNARRMCGIDFLVPHKMKYQLISGTQAEIDLNGKILQLNRIDYSDESKIFGDWELDLNEGEYSGQMIFYIRLDPVLNVDMECEKI